MTAALTAGVVAIAPILLAALGGLVSERSGVMAIGLEGYMIAGAFAGLWGGHAGGAGLGVLTAIGAGLLVGLLVAWLCVTLGANQAVVGIAIIILATGGTGFLNAIVYNGQMVSLPGFSTIPLSGLSKLPMVGSALFNQPAFVYLTGVVTVVLVLYFRFTTSGLALHATGENPDAAQARGVRVRRVRFAAVLSSAVLGALAGAIFTIGQGLQFAPTISQGRGFIALAAIYLGGWRVLPVAFACVLFGFADVAQLWASVVGVNVSASILATVPYVVTLIALALLAHRAAMPSALGAPFEQERRVIAQ